MAIIFEPFHLPQLKTEYVVSCNFLVRRWVKTHSNKNSLAVWSSGSIYFLVFLQEFKNAIFLKFGFFLVKFIMIQKSSPLTASVKTIQPSCKLVW